MDLSVYRELFVTEARSHLDAFGDLIVSLEHDGADRAVIDELFRHAHSLKGMAATMQFVGIASLAHALEDVLDRIRNGTTVLDAALADLLLEGGDRLGSLVDAIANDEEHQGDSGEYLARLQGAAAQQVEAAEETAPARCEQKASSDSSIEPRHQFRQSDSFKTIRIKTEVLDHLVAITGELITVRHTLAEQAADGVDAPLQKPLRHLAALVSELREEVFRARMLPFAFIAERFPRLVRDLARSQGKEVEFHISGNDCELDRGVLEAIAEPLVHILRNAVDHGVENADERVAAGKPYNARLELTVHREKDHVIIAVEDDGRGIDPALVLKKAAAKGIIAADEAASLSLPEIMMLICAPGFSTAEVITDVSGRGVGMDAVKAAVHSLGGVLAISSQPGKGSRFALQLPLTVSILHAVLVSSGDVKVAFPVSTVAKTIELTRHDIFDQNGRKVCRFEDDVIPLKNLNRILGQPLPRRTGQIVSALVVSVGGARVALLADQIHGQQEIFVKPLGRPLSAMKWCNGGTILGNGSIIFIADPSLLT